MTKTTTPGKAACETNSNARGTAISVERGDITLEKVFEGEGVSPAGKVDEKTTQVIASDVANLNKDEKSKVAGALALKLRPQHNKAPYIA